MEAEELARAPPGRIYDKDWHPALKLQWPTLAWTGGAAMPSIDAGLRKWWLDRECTLGPANQIDDILLQGLVGSTTRICILHSSFNGRLSFNGHQWPSLAKFCSPLRNGSGNLKLGRAPPLENGQHQRGVLGCPEFLPS